MIEGSRASRSISSASRNGAVCRADVSFVALARSVYGENDARAALKRAINALANSALIEEKSYA